MTLEEGPAQLGWGWIVDGEHFEEPGVQFPDEGLDSTALSGSNPTLQQHNHRLLGLFQPLL